MLGALIGELMNDRNARSALTVFSKDRYTRLCDELSQIVFKHWREHGVKPAKIPLNSREIMIMVEGWEKTTNGTPHPHRQGAQLEYMGTPVYEWVSPFITSHRRSPPSSINHQA